MAQLQQILRALAEHQVAFIVVGGVAAVLQGAPITTQDLDIVYSLVPPNPDRLLVALQSLDAVFRDDPRRLVPGPSHLATRGHKLLTTRHGDLDCLGSIEDSTIYEDLIEHTDEMQSGGVRFRVLSLPRLIEVKAKLTRPKDQLMLLQLRGTLEERLRRG